MRTVRYLRPRQITGRLIRTIYSPKFDLGPAPDVRLPTGAWTIGPKRISSMLSHDRFRFLNVEGSIADRRDWDRPGQSRLWRYNLHYFNDLHAATAGQRVDWHRRLLLRWVRENPPGIGTGWEPYPTSLRIVNWIKWALAGNQLDSDVLHSLAVQTRCLEGRLETHLLGNHLWSNAVALAFAGSFFSGKEAGAWMGKAHGLISRELSEQVLSDGGHFELSPMYHALFLEDVLDLINLHSVYPDRILARLVNELRSTAGTMLQWLRVMTHPDGQIAFFNDSAFEIARNYDDLKSYAEKLGITVEEAPLDGVRALPDSGYVRLQNQRAVAICDVGRIGPDHLPAHAHADTLSFELSVDGSRTIVNGGTSTYEPGAERQRQRGTAAHSTVVINDRDSSEVWASFRVGRRARPLDVQWGQGSQGIWLEAAHDGYRRMGRGSVHRRRWDLGRHGLTVTDIVEGHFHNAVSFLHVHPDARIVQSGDGTRLTLEGGRGSAVSLAFTSRYPTTAPGTWHPRFGVAESATTLATPIDGSTLQTRIEW